MLIPESGNNIRTQRLRWLLHCVFFTLALTGFRAGEATEDSEGDTAGGAEANTEGISSAKTPRGDFWSNFNLNALDLNIYGLAYHPARETVNRNHLNNQFSSGLGLRYELSNSERGITFAEVGAY